MPETENRINVVCPGCTTVNRVPDNRLGDAPICGRCQARLLPAHPVELGETTFSKFVSKSDTLVIVDFWAEWCGPCRRMAPEFSEAAKHLSPHIVLAKLNTQEAPQSATPFNIAGIPCLIAFKNGREVARQAGLMNRDQIVQWARSIPDPPGETN